MTHGRAIIADTTPPVRPLASTTARWTLDWGFTAPMAPTTWRRLVGAWASLTHAYSINSACNKFLVSQSAPRNRQNLSKPYSLNSRCRTRHSRIKKAPICTRRKPQETTSRLEACLLSSPVSSRANATERWSSRSSNRQLMAP